MFPKPPSNEPRITNFQPIFIFVSRKIELIKKVKSSIMIEGSTINYSLIKF